MSDRSELFMRDSDAFSWYLEKDPGLRSTIVAVAWLDGQPDFEALSSRLERATRLAPRFRQRPVEPPGRLATPRWVDADFHLPLHLHRIDSPPPHTPTTVLDVARVQAMSGFDRSRPLWEFTLIGHLEDDGAALVMKVHHSLTDGIGGMQLAFLLFDTTRDDTTRHPAAIPDLGPEPPRRVPGTADLVRESVAYEWDRVVETARRALADALPTTLHIIRNPRRAASDALATARSVARFVEPVADTLSPIMTARSLDRRLHMLSVDLHDLKRAGAAVGGTLNDAFVASVTGGLRRYHERHAAPVEELRITLPISIRKEDDPAGGNRITLERFKVPIGVIDAAERVRLTGRHCRAARDDRAQPLSNVIAGILNLLPSGVVGSMLKHIDFLASNVPGVDIPIYLGGAPVLGYYVFGPTTGSAVNVTLLSYQDTCCIGFTIDAAAVADHEVLMECFRAGFEEVLALSGDHRPVERPAGGPAPASGAQAPPSR
ncbi:MAG: wax ester/triacylglycerol synthase domain-containing protein [Acidimicrobiales bacterium]